MSTVCPIEDRTSGVSRILRLGNVDADGEEFAIPFERSVKANLHMGVFGAPGSGKTGLMTVIIEEAAISGVPCVIISQGRDITGLAKHGDASEIDDLALSLRLAELADKVDVTVFAPGQDPGVNLALNPLAIPTQAELLRRGDIADRREYEQIIDEVAAILTNLTGTNADTKDGRKQRGFLSRLLLQLWTTAEKLPSIGQLSEIIRNPTDDLLRLANHYAVEKKLEDLSVGLQLLTQGANANLYTYGLPLTPEVLVEPRDGKTPVSVLLIESMSTSSQQQFLASLSNLIFEWGTRQPIDDSTVRLLYCVDEAQVYAPAGSSKPVSQPPLETLARLGRKYGIVLVVASQTPGSVDLNIRSNLGTTFVGNLSDSYHISKLSDYIRANSKEPTVILSAIPGLKSRNFIRVSAGMESTTFKVRNMLTSLQSLSEDELTAHSEVKVPLIQRILDNSPDAPVHEVATALGSTSGGASERAAASSSVAPADLSEYVRQIGAKPTETGKKLIRPVHVADAGTEGDSQKEAKAKVSINDLQDMVDMLLDGPPGEMRVRASTAAKIAYVVTTISNKIEVPLEFESPDYSGCHDLNHETEQVEMMLPQLCLDPALDKQLLGQKQTIWQCPELEYEIVVKHGKYTTDASYVEFFDFSVLDVPELDEEEATEALRSHVDHQLEQITKKSQQKTDAGLRDFQRLKEEYEKAAGYYDKLFTQWEATVLELSSLRKTMFKHENALTKKLEAEAELYILKPRRQTLEKRYEDGKKVLAVKKETVDKLHAELTEAREIAFRDLKITVNGFSSSQDLIASFEGKFDPQVSSRSYVYMLDFTLILASKSETIALEEEPVALEGELPSVESIKQEKHQTAVLIALPVHEQRAYLLEQVDH